MGAIYKDRLNRTFFFHTGISPICVLDQNVVRGKLSPAHRRRGPLAFHVFLTYLYRCVVVWYNESEIGAPLLLEVAIDFILAISTGGPPQSFTATWRGGGPALLGRQRFGRRNRESQNDANVRDIDLPREDLQQIP